MAKLTPCNISKIEKVNRIHDDALCTYNTFEHEGMKYIQFDTYGSSGRVMKDKISQSIQFDKNTAVFMVDILKKEFNLE